MKLLNYLWRCVGSTLFYPLFGVIGLVNCFLVIPLLSVLIRDRQRLQVITRALIHRQFQLFVLLSDGPRIISVEFRGLEWRNPAGGQLVLASHPTLIDVVLLLSVLPQVDCVVKEGVMRNPVLGAVARAANYISNRDPEQMLDECAARLRAGSSLILFPEGTRSIAGEPPKLKLGAAEIAVRADAEILPVVIRCEPQILGKHQPWYYVPRKRAEFLLRFLEPIQVADILAAWDSERQPRYAVNDYLYKLYTGNSR